MRHDEGKQKLHKSYGKEMVHCDAHRAHSDCNISSFYFCFVSMHCMHIQFDNHYLLIPFFPFHTSLMATCTNLPLSPIKAQFSSHQLNCERKYQNSMEPLKKPAVATLLALVLSFCNASMSSMENQKSSYIVKVDKSQMPASFMHHSEWYDSCLKSVSNSAKTIYVYENIHGFSTRLTPQEAQLLKNQPGVLAVLQDRMYRIHTTRTPQFLGLDKPKDVPIEANATHDVIIGLLDTGIWPESKSFDDAGMGPIPKSWKGICEEGHNFTKRNCNKKLIGARVYNSGHLSLGFRIDESNEFKSPRDANGHGSHTTTTAAGSPVKGANLLGYANGTARGMVPRARVAMYKVCWGPGFCAISDILAAMDQAISDNVDILSLSLGGSDPEQYYKDNIAIGAFAAIEKGILVSCSAGNSGPEQGKVVNLAPWIVSVGASTIDRDFPAYVTLGNGKRYHGMAIYNGTLLPNNTLLPLIYSANASVSGVKYCVEDDLIPEKVKGKIVVCDHGFGGGTEMGHNVKLAGGLGMVMANIKKEGEDTLAEAHVLPASAVGFREGEAIRKYVLSDPNPRATIKFYKTRVGVKPAPVIAAFSSRGPNKMTPQILKPDLIAPGINILAAWSGVASPSGLDSDKRRVDFNIVSGTSMSCPHVSGLAAMIKSVHPEWSPAVIRSALMTTANTTYADGKRFLDSATMQPSTPLAYGAGHVNPVAALNPGLVYDLTVDDYLDFLCAIHYTADQIKMVTSREFHCDKSKQYSVTALNYPSFAVVFESGETVVKHTRTLTNVGSPGTYNVSVTLETQAVKVSVEPQVLSFRKNEKKSYTVTFTSTGPILRRGQFGFGRLEWSDGKTVVGSPITFDWSQH